MTIQKHIPSSQITSESIYLTRRNFIKKAALLYASVALAVSCTERSKVSSPTGSISPSSDITSNDVLTNYEDIIDYTNFYEFSTDKYLPSELAKNMRLSPWEVKVDGLVNNPGTYDIDDLRKPFPSEERIYRLRCVEAWSMVIPWLGFPLKVLLDEVEPMSEAKYVKFESLFDPQQMPGQKSPFYVWPYIEGLRIDEAMHDLTLLATGLYGKDLLPQNGAPIRLVVPWKYGFKSIKSIVHIELVSDMTTSLWMASNPYEYGFYANVNPDVPHPRWSQATERRIGETKRRKTELFNGYADQVASLYQGMDLTINF